MPRILVRPEYLREFGAQWQRTAGELQSIAGRLGGAIGSLDWETRQQAGVEGMVNEARRRAGALAGQAEAFARYLASKAQAFEEADRAGVSAIGQVMGAFTEAWHQAAGWWQRLQPVLNFPRTLLNRVLSLGQVLLGTPVTWAVTFVSSAGGLLVGTRPLRPVSQEWRGRVDEAVQRGPSATVTEALPAPTLQPANPRDFSSCARYAQARRPDLKRPIGGDGGAYNYIKLYRDTRQYYRLPPEVKDLRATPLQPGVAVVWDKADQEGKRVHGADPTYGHVAIIEEVGPDYIEVSEAGWGPSGRRRIPVTQLPDLHFIL